MSETEDIKPPRRRARRVLLWILAALGVLVVACGVTLMALVGTQVTAPDWLRTRITERINADAEDLQLGVGDMSIVVEDDWVPRLSLRDVTVRDDSGQTLAN